MTFDTRFSADFEETPKLDELWNFAEGLSARVTPELDEAAMPLLTIEKDDRPRMEIALLDAGVNAVFDWAFAPGNDLYTGNAEAAKKAIAAHFA